MAPEAPRLGITEFTPVRICAADATIPDTK